ncbi:response regulator transcription factor [Bradyrhizobium acaciae]|uniref:response regulator transcription factor n=1 Tax=Bradyrhizobium acaciae TaxID=2683706 RepID=UPI00237C22DD|nr:response regulator [Bradyrhizobium acaciae]MCC8977918.1 response regulator [Bradyrhizobium acaciae]
MTGRFDSPSEVSNAESSTRAVVFFVEDDISKRRLRNRFQLVGLGVVASESAHEMLRSTIPAVIGCLVLDVRLSGLSGLDYQTELTRLSIHIPIIFIAGHGDIPVTSGHEGRDVRFSQQTVRDQEVLDAVVAATERDRKRRKARQIVAHLRCRFESLSPREQRVMKLVAAGLMNKRVAAELGLAGRISKTPCDHWLKRW